ncbi:MAG: DUF308 domain-containing protein [Christensenellaceae bacterium]|nr:DUF308 domain-containing protein [Christensenellaceae bacterium]
MELKNKVIYLAISVIMVILGICMIAQPGNSASLICIAIGIALLVISALMIIRFLSAEEKSLSLQILLAIAVVIAIFGIFMLFRSKWILSLLNILLGIGILVDGIFKLIKALETKAHNLDKWWVVLLLALITCGLGLLLIFNPFGGIELLMTFIGIILIVEGVQNIWVGLYAFRKKTQ